MALLSAPATPVSETPAATNLLPFSRLPLGFPNGWGWAAETIEGEAVTESAAPDGAGFPALRLHSPDAYSILGCGTLTAPPAPGEYVLLLRARCTGSGGLAPMLFAGNSPKIAEQRFDLTEEATTLRLGFTTPDPATAPWMAFSMGVWGDVLLEGVAVVPAADEAGYAFDAHPQVVFQLAPGGDAAAARTSFADEPTAVRYHASGGVAGGVLRLRIVTPYGETWPLAGAPLVGEPATGALDVIAQLPAHRRMGSFRLEGWVERGGRVLSPVQEYVFHRLPRPRHWGEDAPESRFGIHTLANPRHLTMAKAAGLNWVRSIPGPLMTGWASLEPAPGQWAWDDAGIARLRRHGFSILAVMMTTPPWASTLPPERAATTVWGVPRLEDYRAYVRAFAARYRGSIGAYDVWNEPWYVGQLAGRYVDGKLQYPEAPASVFVALAKATFDTVREVDPGTPVVSLGLGSGQADDAGPVLLGAYQIVNWDSLVLRAGGYGYSDGSYSHMYLDNERTLFPGDRVETIRAGVRASLAHFGLPADAKPHWNTEGSPMQVTLGQGLYARTFPFGPQEDLLAEADTMARYLASSVANGMEKTFLYTLHCQWYDTVPVRFNTMAVGGGWMHPVGSAIAAATWRLDGTEPAGRLDLAQGVHAYLFREPGRAVAAVSTGPTHAPWDLPAKLPDGIAAADVYGNSLPDGYHFDGKLLWISGPSVEALERLLIPEAAGRPPVGATPKAGGSGRSDRDGAVSAGTA